MAKNKWERLKVKTGIRMAFPQESPSTTRKSIKSRKNPERRKPSLSKLRIYPKRRKVIAMALCQFNPCYRDLHLPPFLWKDEWKKVINAIKLINPPAKNEINPSPGLVKVPKSWMIQPEMLISPMASQNKLLTKSFLKTNLPWN
jgi:hypothetical protein